MDVHANLIIRQFFLTFRRKSDKFRFPMYFQIIRIWQEIEFLTILSYFKKLQYIKHEDSLPLYTLHNLEISSYTTAKNTQFKL